ncbi:MAG TPA: PilZ domain-containing protein [Gammaproteobacteria bacterium]|nr:PilZ domain-containing protein [Gammaproteobacteria bacterium]
MASTRPEQEQRVTFRVAVRAGSGIDAYVVLAGKKLAAKVGDISAEGIFVKLDRGAIAALKPDSKVDVEVAFDGEIMVLHGVIRSEHAGGYGIHFPARDRAGRANPLAKFERISASLQRSSLSQRLKILKL